MKKLFICSLLSVGLLAKPSNNDKDLALKMKKLQNNMEEIQRAGLYNSIDSMTVAVESLKKNIKFVKDMKVKHFLPEYQKFATKFAEQREKMIEMYADDMLDSIKHKKLDDALDDYTQILRQCTSCHMRLREW